MDELKRTALHSWHVEHGANIAPFGQYEMPLWYRAGVKAEHLAVITGAGIFDTSHMAVVTVTGENARALLQFCFSKDLDHCVGLKKNPLSTGRCVYGIFLNQDGTTLDDAIVYQTGETAYMVVVNAGMGAGIATRLVENNGEYGAVVTDRTDRVGKMDIQGPLAAKVMKKLLADPETVFDKLVYFSFKGGFDDISSEQPVILVDGTSIMLSRTGYTGEFGFELFLSIDDFVKVWRAVAEAGQEFGVLPCGLAARDSLRAGAVLPLSHQDIGPWPFKANPWPFAVAYNDDGSGFTKSFIGSDALADTANYLHTLPFAGYDPRKIVVADTTFVTDLEGNHLGRILTCATDMAIGRVDGRIYSIVSSEESGKPADFSPKGLSCGFVQISENLPVGTEVILTDGKRKKIKVEIVSDVRPDRTARRPMKEML
ncbi:MULTISPECIES: aminomethyltransferase family protein [Desulfosediminicola]|uniref:aminomethyltransferase family protein n=1 Tax=Desulfosediminicola TaxID=2886823 RepID=UPI0010AD08EE|nr:aminomethyl transferase family protein [Desulfosediminicola ganghwensis]